MTAHFMTKQGKANKVHKFGFALAAGLLVAASANAQDAQKLVVASFYPVDKVAGWTGLIDAYSKRYPGVEVEVQVTPFDQYLPKLLSQIAGGDPPDIIAVENSPFPQFANKKILEDLTPYLAKTQGFSTSDFFPALMDRYTVEGRVYGVPYDAQPIAMLFYNPALFHAAGVEVPTYDWNWDTLREASRKLAAAGGAGSYGICMSDDATNTWQEFLYGGGGSLVDDVRQPTKSLIDAPEAVAATQFLLDLTLTDKSMPTNDSLEAMGGADQGCTSLFLSGKSAMMISGMWKAVENPQAFADLGVKVTMLPTKDVANRVYPTGGTAYAILASSENKDTAWNFITEFLGQAGYEAAYKEAMLGAIYPPAHKGANEWYMQQPIKFVDTLQANADALGHVRFAPFTLNWTEVQTKCISPDIPFILNASTPVEEGLKKISDCVSASL
jgi:multiple sugar transport system substrate-binding protein